MKKFLALLLVLMLTLALVACGGEADSEETEGTDTIVEGDDAAVTADYDQLLVYTQALCDVEESMSEFTALREGVQDGSVSEEDVLAVYEGVSQQTADIYTQLGAAAWQSDAYTDEVANLNAASEALALYAATTYEAMANNDAAALEEAAPIWDTYQTQMDALLTALGA